MSITAPKDTLAYQRKGRPLALKRNIGGIKVTDSIPPMHAFANKYGSPKPETEALWFYMTNHAIREIEFRFDPDEPLPAPVLEIVEEYNRINSVIAARAFYYLLLITCRESRHCHKKDEIAPHVTASWGAEAMQGMRYYPDQNSVAAVTSVFSKHTPTATLTQVSEAVRYSFYTPGGYSGGYGGKAWGKVSDCLVAYVNGEYTAEMMLDTVWTLCHNNGPIFNKGMLYAMYGSHLTEILDIQRSGQIPQLVMTNQSVSSRQYVTAEMREFAAKIAALFPDSDAFKAEGTAQIDWHMVEALGSVNKYASYKSGGASASPEGYKKKPPVSDHSGYSSPGSLKPGDSMHAKTIGKGDFALAQHPGMTFKKKTRKEIA